MVKLGSDFHLAVSEVEFFTCTSKCAWLCFYYHNACGNFINPVATVQMTTEPQSIDDMTKTPAIITTITTTEVNVITTGSTFTTSEITTTSQDQDIANVTVIGLGKSYSNTCNTYSIPFCCHLYIQMKLSLEALLKHQILELLQVCQQYLYLHQLLLLYCFCGSTKGDIKQNKTLIMTKQRAHTPHFTEKVNNKCSHNYSTLMLSSTVKLN